jgi:hypothetical protein
LELDETFRASRAPLQAGVVALELGDLALEQVRKPSAPARASWASRRQRATLPDAPHSPMLDESRPSRRSRAPISPGFA